ncbi:MAG TPA: hypothetical protein VGR16_05925 [Thermomicrobiales bacterium]|nr:hypothetical protein [Thermomicrobiales bacterium]
MDWRLPLVGAMLRFALVGVQFVSTDIRVKLSIRFVVLAARALSLARVRLGTTFRGAWNPAEWPSRARRATK